MIREHCRMKDLLPDYAGQRLHGEEAERVRDHLMICSACRKDLSLIGLMLDDPVPEPPSVFWTSLPGKVTSSAGAKRRGRSRFPVPAWGWGLAAAALVTLFVIGPWKSSEIGDSLGISTMLDDSRQPVDEEVFMRALRYYEIQSVGRGGAADVDGEAGRK